MEFLFQNPIPLSDGYECITSVEAPGSTWCAPAVVLLIMTNVARAGVPRSIRGRV